MKNISALSVYLVLFMVLKIVPVAQNASQGSSFMQGQPITKASEKIPLRTLLDELGDKNGVYFTLEELFDSNTPSRNMESRPEQRGATLDLSRLTELKQEHSDLQFWEDPRNSRIMHILNRRLLQVRGYSLTLPVTSFTFVGSRSDLLAAVSKATGARIQMSTAFGPSFSIDASKVRVSVQQSTVRDVLTAACDIARVHLLWKSITRIKSDGVSDTTIEFIAPPKK